MLIYVGWILVLLALIALVGNVLILLLYGMW